MTVSGHYRRIRPEDVDAVARTFSDAWKDPSLPETQYELAVRKELQNYRSGVSVAPFDVFINLLKFIPAGRKTLLDVGASSGYYSEVLRIRGFENEYEYTGLDYSTYFKDLAVKLFPGIRYEVGSATALPFEAKSFDVILHGACIMHCPEYGKAISEAARVARQAVIFHRTPIYLDDTPTTAFSKTAYGIPCIEWHFNETEIVDLFYRNKLEIRATSDVFIDGNFAHRSYLLFPQ